MTVQEVRDNYDQLLENGHINSEKVCIAELTINSVHYEVPLSKLREFYSNLIKKEA